MKPIAAIWHIPNRGLPGAGDYPVAVISIVGGAVLQAIVVDTARQVRNAPLAELEVIDADVIAALAVAQTRISTGR
jgi:hypothetical protein